MIITHYTSVSCVPFTDNVVTCIHAAGQWQCCRMPANQDTRTRVQSKCPSTSELKLKGTTTGRNNGKWRRR